MRNLALTLLAALMALNISAQRSQKNKTTQSERNLYELTSTLNVLMDSKMPSDKKEALTIRAIKDYVMTSQADEIMSATPCNRDKTIRYLKQLKLQNFDEVPTNFIKKLGNIKTDCALSKAVEIYNLVGHNLVSNDQLCHIMGCDDIVVKKPGKGGSYQTSQETKWEYTGVRRYFVEKDKFGWRYLCIVYDAKSDKKLSNKEVQNAVDQLEKAIALNEESGRKKDNTVLPLSIEKSKLAWKLDYQVHIW